MSSFRSRHAASSHSVSSRIAQDNTDTDATEQLPRSFNLKRKKTLRLDKFLLLSSISALTILILATLAITFLWFGKDTNPYWQEIVREDRTAQVVTVSTLAIRLAVATHAGLAVSMLACISVEWRDGVLLRQIPAMFVNQYAHLGPIFSLLNFWKNRNFPIFTIVACLACTSLISHFTSTVLLSDVRSGSVLGRPTEHNLPFGIALDDYVDVFSRLMLLSPNYFESSQPDFSTFAEWSEDPKSQSEYIADTGRTVRALLPIADKEQRTSLLNYSGAASLFDARVVCMRPNLTEWKFYPSNYTASLPATLSVKMLPDSIPNELAHLVRLGISSRAPDAELQLSCSLNQFGRLQDYRAFRACVPLAGSESLLGQGGGLINQLDPTQNDTLQYTLKGSWTATSEGPEAAWRVDLGRMIILMEAQTSSVVHGENETLEAVFTSPNATIVAGDRGVWLDFTPTSEGKNGRISITTCFDAINSQQFTNRLTHVQDFNISATRDATHTEPAPNWSNSEGSIDTKNIRNQLGVSRSNEDGARRGVLRLDMEKVDAALERYIASFSPEKNWNATITNRLSLPPVLNAIFTDTMDDTGNPALAWQALMTSVLRNAYYDWLPAFTVRGNMTTTHMVPCQRPVRRLGFYIVMVVLAVHFSLVVAVCMWFYSATRYTVVGDVWQVVEQLRAKEIDDLCDAVPVVNERVIEKAIRGSDQLRKQRVRFYGGLEDEEALLSH
ncbi:hypothetical protein N0V90_013173 [Kalmusia sp. IMI 367209]|nr:hypothetical protein N0V90_013173 [Kalmusia sp. IMI 367209]